MPRGIRGISGELDRVIERLPRKALSRVVKAALEITAMDCPSDVEIRVAIEAYLRSPSADRELAGRLARKSKECDDLYIQFEEEGQFEESVVNFRKMCICNALTLLLGTGPLSLDVVDRFIYDLGHGASDTDMFAKMVLEKLISEGSS